MQLSFRKSVLSVAAGLAMLFTGIVQAQSSHSPHGWTDNPNSPAYDHPYRHGALATRETTARMHAWEHAQSANFAAPTASTGKLSFGGGVNGIGVLSGHAKVYLVFYGTQWGAQSTDANGYAKFSGDAYGAAQKAQAMFKGIGTNGELWSADLTQWCDGSYVARGATSCPANAAFVPYQSGGVLAGVWYDNAAPSPASASAAQLANEAIKAAAHFGNTTGYSNRYTYYVILSPHGTDPDNYKSPTQGYCAWHDYTADAGVSSPYGNLAFSNQPYNIDVGGSCGVNFVNAGTAGNLDGYTMTLGHEWHETMSDQFPAGGWTNQTGGSYDGQENSDECAWIVPGVAGGAANITFSTGTFAEQASWSNDTGACAISHPIVQHGVGGTPSASFSYTTNGLIANFTDTSTDSGGTIGSHSWTFGDGGSSTASNPQHTYTAAGTYNVSETVKDSSTGKTSTVTKAITVSVSTLTQLLGNTGFETGTAAPWIATAGVIDNSNSEPAHGGSWKAWMDGYGSAHTDTVSQTAAIPPGKSSGTLSFYLHIDTAETGSTAYDKLTVTVGSTTVATFSNVNAAAGYQLHTYNVPVTAGSSVTIKFSGAEDSMLQTSFVLDDVTFTVH